MKNVTDIATEALEIIEALKKAGVAAVLAGGCARDLAHAIEPKDYDIVVYENQGANALIDKLTTVGFYALEPYGDTCSTREDVRDDLDCVIHGCAPNGAVCDILIYTCDFDSPEEVVRTFDCTLNMAWLGVGDFGQLTVQTVEDYPTPIQNFAEVVPNVFVPGVDETRARYIAGKFPQYIHNRT